MTATVSPGLTPNPARPLAKPVDTFAHLPIGLAFEIAVNDFLIGKLAQRISQQIFDQQRVSVSRWGLVYGVVSHYVVVLSGFAWLGKRWPVP
jgi:hypothetical protein